MIHSSRWCAVAGVLAVSLTGALAMLATHVSSRSSATASAPGPSAAGQSLQSRPLDAARAPSWARSGALDTTPIVSPARRQERIESTLQPLLLKRGLRAGVFGFDPSSGAFFTLDGDQSFAAASLIKIPIAVATLLAVDRGEIRLNEVLQTQPEHIAAGSGRIQYMPLGSPFSIERLCDLMIRRSDNTATNMLISRLGGIERTNAIFAAWGLGRTQIANPLPDLDGTNRTSPQDLVTILHKALDEGLLAPDSRSRLLSWMSRSHVRSMIPASVTPGTFVANKTGDIPGALGDAGYVLAAGGHRYLLAVQVERPRNSARAKELIRSVSGAVWETMTGQPSPIAQRRGSARADSEPRASRTARSRRATS